jgi:hypothetical protein
VPPPTSQCWAFYLWYTLAFPPVRPSVALPFAVTLGLCISSEANPTLRRPTPLYPALIFVAYCLDKCVDNRIDFLQKGG